MLMWDLIVREIVRLKSSGMGTHGNTQAMTMTRAKTMTKTLTNYREFKIMVSGLFYTLLVLIGAVTFGAIHLSNILPETYRTRFSASLAEGAPSLFWPKNPDLIQARRLLCPTCTWVQWQETKGTRI